MAPSKRKNLTTGELGSVQKRACKDKQLATEESVSLLSPQQSTRKSTRNAKQSTLLEVLDSCEKTGKCVNQVFMELPDASYDSDEDDALEDAGGIIDNVNGRQLSAYAEARLCDGEVIGNLEGEDDPQDEHQARVTDNFLKQLHSRRYNDWHKVDRTKEHIKDLDFFPNEDIDLLFDEYGKMDPVRTFELLFDNDLFQMLQVESSRYALHEGRRDPEFTIEELKQFFGVLILSGYAVLPAREDYWSHDPDLHNELVSSSLRRDRFDQFMTNSHWVDKTKVSEKDKLWKVRPLVEGLKKNFRKFYFPQTTALNYDEAMIKYFGRHGCKQFIPVKPIRFGFKVWCLNAPNGYMLDFIIYQGNDPSIDSTYKIVFGKCTAPLIAMLEKLKYKNLPYDLFHDNLFTSQALLDYSRHLGYTCTGTVRKGRIPKCFPWSDQPINRGDFEYIYSKESDTMVIRWYDNKVVTVASNGYGIEPLASVKRWSKTSNKFIKLPQPNAIAQYNQNMGGTDRMNQNVNNYRIGIRSKKWYNCIVTWAIDVALQNAWLLYRQFGEEPNIPFYDFKRRIARFYLESFASKPNCPGRYRTFPDGTKNLRTAPELRYDQRDHLVDTIPADQYSIPLPKDLRKRCAMRCDARSTTFWCTKCKVPLHPDKCFREYHTKACN